MGSLTTVAPSACWSATASGAHRLPQPAPCPGMCCHNTTLVPGLQTYLLRSPGLPGPHHHLLTMPQSSPKLKAPQRIPQQLWPGARSHSELRQHKAKEESSRHLRDPHKKPVSGYRQGAELYINARLLWKRLSPDLCSLLTPSKIFCWRTKERH